MEVKAAGTRADKITTFMYRLSRNLGASISWNPQEPSGPVAYPGIFFGEGGVQQIQLRTEITGIWGL